MFFSVGDSVQKYDRMALEVDTHLCFES
jgi:hypothetical protein